MTVTLAELKVADVLDAAALHRLAFPNFFLSRLGVPFLIQFYSGFIGDASAVTVIAHDENHVIRGIVVGTVQPQGFFSRLLRQRWRGFLVASAQAVLVNPGSFPRLLRAVRYRGDGPSGQDGALLSSICVDPATRGRGVGQLLIDRWVHELAARRVATAFLTTDAEGNDGVNRFYLSSGWRLYDSFTTRAGRSMNRYALSVDGYQCPQHDGSQAPCPNAPAGHGSPHD